MSPSWRDQVRIVLCPRHVAVMRQSRGWSPRVTGKQVVSCDAARPGEPLWHNALAALATVLPEYGAHRADAVVVLSNHFARYALVMHSDALVTAEEEQALVRHHFAGIYGDAVEHWALCLSDADGGVGSRVACAIDRDLRESLRALLQPTSLNLRSIQPYLMTAFNQWRRRFGDSAWFALVEPDRLCLARFRNNQWHSLKAIKIGDDWFGDLKVQLDREKTLAGHEAADSANNDPVFVFAPGFSEPIPAQAQELPVQVLRTPRPPGDVEAACGMALAG